MLASQKWYVDAPCVASFLVTVSLIELKNYGLYLNCLSFWWFTAFVWF